jgi:hypothetical protein
MERVTITIEGTAEDVIKALQAVAGGVKGQVAAVSWLPDEIEGFFNELQPEARRILREIATKPQGYDRDDLLKKLGISGKGMAGRLSSIGHNIRRSYPMKPSPIELNDETWEYTMLPEFADWFASL